VLACLYFLFLNFVFAFGVASSQKIAKMLVLTSGCLTGRFKPRGQLTDFKNTLANTMNEIYVHHPVVALIKQ
jgi:hypothetical protein